MRRFPPPWTIEEHNNACFIVKDATGQAFAFFYFEEEPGRRSAAKLLIRDEARRMAVNFAKLPVLLRRKQAVRCNLNLNARWNVARARRFLRTAKVLPLAHSIRQHRQQ
jgi:hypothetical protein